MGDEIFANPKNVKFRDLSNFCEKHFEKTKQKKGSSHFIFKTGVRGDPLINIQEARDGMAKPYQVEQVESAYRKLMNRRPNDERDSLRKE